MGQAEAKAWEEQTNAEKVASRRRAEIVTSAKRPLQAYTTDSNGRSTLKRHVSEGAPQASLAWTHTPVFEPSFPKENTDPPDLSFPPGDWIPADYVPTADELAFWNALPPPAWEVVPEDWHEKTAAKKRAYVINAQNVVWRDPLDIPGGLRMFVPLPETYHRSDFANLENLVRTKTEFMVQSLMVTYNSWRRFVPDQNCIETQVLYILADPRRFLLVAQYIHADAGLLLVGRTVRPPTPTGLEREYARYSKDKIIDRYMLRSRMPQRILDEHFAKDQLVMYLELVALIMRVPRTPRDPSAAGSPRPSPMICVRGQKDILPWIRREHKDADDIFEFDCPQRYTSTSIISASLSESTALSFARAGPLTRIFVFHVAENVPWIYMNVLEYEILLPPGLRWTLYEVSVNPMHRHGLYFHIAVEMAPLEFV